MAGGFARLTLSLKAVAEQAESTATSMREAGKEADKYASKYASIIDDLDQKTFHGGGLDLSQAIKTQTKEVALIQQSGAAGEALEAYAAYAKRLAEPGASPEAYAYFSEWMLRIEQLVRQRGGAAGRDFNFSTFRSEIQEFVREQARLVKEQKRENDRSKRTGGLLGRSGQAPAASGSLSIFRWNGGLP